MTINYEFRVHPNGKPAMVTLRKPVKLVAHQVAGLREARVSRRRHARGSRVRREARLIIHGEPWEDARTMTFDRNGKVKTTHFEHYQAKDPPPRFR